jgi:hypothetical protein
MFYGGDKQTHAVDGRMSYKTAAKVNTMTHLRAESLAASQPSLVASLVRCQRNCAARIQLSQPLPAWSAPCTQQASPMCVCDGLASSFWAALLQAGSSKGHSHPHAPTLS